LSNTVSSRRHRGGVAEDTRHRHLTITDICTDLDITRSTFYDWRTKRKAPPCLKLPNGGLRVRRDDYEEWLLLHYEEMA